MKIKQNLKSWIKHNLYLLWIILGSSYIIAFPFIYVYYHTYIPTDLLIVMGDAVPAVAFFVSFITTFMLVSYLLRYFRIIYYPKGRRFE